jgi:hypothetical protein
MNRRTVYFLRGVILALKHGWDAETLAIKHDNRLPVVEVEEVDGELDANLLMLRG